MWRNIWQRLQLAWAALCGRPVASNILVYGTLVAQGDGAVFVNCTVKSRSEGFMGGDSLIFENVKAYSANGYGFAIGSGKIVVGD